ncbi:hypothetical protein KY385_02450 [Candidatus Parcubacteria bacterium]|nr:hypothetical protein [Candidatus Parcubacteria bacterium]
MGKPKKRTSHRKTASRRSHHVLKLARQVNARSLVKVFTTKRETGRSTKGSGSLSKKTETAKKAN